ncbi:phosphotransferase enzyme family protein [Colletotrichum graminicola]|nr:phosphotransferase enzyme family protein [Colletotrichum graminicola]
MERAEAKAALATMETSLSARMRDSWDSGRFWFNLAPRSILMLTKFTGRRCKKMVWARLFRTVRPWRRKRHSCNGRKPSLTPIEARRKGTSALQISGGWPLGSQHNSEDGGRYAPSRRRPFQEGTVEP